MTKFRTEIKDGEFRCWTPKGTIGCSHSVVSDCVHSCHSQAHDYHQRFRERFPHKITRTDENLLAFIEEVVAEECEENEIVFNAGKLAERAALTSKVEGMKLTGQFLHDGDVYTPRDINAALDDILTYLRSEATLNYFKSTLNEPRPESPKETEEEVEYPSPYPEFKETECCDRCRGWCEKNADACPCHNSKKV